MRNGVMRDGEERRKKGHVVDSCITWALMWSVMLRKKRSETSEYRAFLTISFQFRRVSMALTEICFKFSFQSQVSNQQSRWGTSYREPFIFDKN